MEFQLKKEEHLHAIMVANGGLLPKIRQESKAKIFKGIRKIGPAFREH